MGAVNFPQVALPEHPGKQGILHVHRNEPGMLAKVNAILSEAQINIASQYLETDRRVGYAVIDMMTRVADSARPCASNSTR